MSSWYYVVVHWYSMIYNIEFRPVGMMCIRIALTSMKVHKIWMRCLCLSMFEQWRVLYAINSKGTRTSAILKVTRLNTLQKAKLLKFICTNLCVFVFLLYTVLHFILYNVLFQKKHSKCKAFPRQYNCLKSGLDRLEAECLLRIIY